MEKITDWRKLWRELVEIQQRGQTNNRENKPDKDFWVGKARCFDASVRQRWSKPDAHRDFILSRLASHPEATVLDIGAGTGAWAIHLARHAEKVTAVEPSSEMIRVMSENLEREGTDNVEIIQGAWPEVGADPHDFSLCSHAMYGYPDLPSFIRAMIGATRQTCFMLFRAPDAHGLMAEAAMKIWGQPNDSPNFQIAYGVMLQMGLHPNVLMEHPGAWPPWTSDSIEEAMKDLKRRFGLSGSSEHDAFLSDLLTSRLTLDKDRYIWPMEMRTALVYWDVFRSSFQSTVRSTFLLGKRADSGKV